MTVASTTHRRNGPLAAKGGFELPLTNLVAAATLAAAGPGLHSLGPRLPRSLAVAAAAGGGVLAAVSLAKLLTHRPAPASRPAEPASRRPARLRPTLLGPRRNYPYQDREARWAGEPSARHMAVPPLHVYPIPLM